MQRVKLSLRVAKSPSSFAHHHSFIPSDHTMCKATISFSNSLSHLSVCQAHYSSRPLLLSIDIPHHPLCVLFYRFLLFRFTLMIALVYFFLSFDKAGLE